MQTAEMVTKAFLFFLFTKSLIESYLDNRNRKNILANRNKVPEKFETQITLEEHQKAADYSIAKIQVAKVFNFIELVVLLIWTLGGGIQALDVFARTLALSEIMTSVAFFAIYLLISMLLSLPQSIYSTFVLEEKFGFNKTTPKTFIVDNIKGIILGAVIGMPILYGILWMMNALGQYWWAYAWAFLTIVQFVIIWAYPRFIAPLFNKFSELEEGDVKEKVNILLEKTGFESNGLFVMDASIRSSHGNAYFTGFGKNKRIVFFDTLIKNLTPDEVVAVLAHELGHFKRKHIIKGLVKGIVFSFIGFAILGFLASWAPFFKGHGVLTTSTHSALLLFMMVAGVYTYWLIPLNAMTSRKYEFEADEFASQYSSARDLITALVKLYKHNASTLTPDEAYSKFYHSHPPALIRVQHLESL
ncbi:M48 family metallopeptidase [Halobacteriovorax sp. HLS]|uniref:M48 family metallopeptidase n=1 Tax=Halobacteriovorax sp. HLS TaxID=2234000 RepID=UPI000FD8A082|nr:M48 family metallopeptidase [Halobacteriovorax sp. HLS]